MMMGMNTRPNLVEQILALIAHGHSPFGVAGHLDMTEEELLEIMHSHPETERLYKIAQGKAVFNVEVPYLDEMMRPSTRNLLTELSVRHGDFWGKTAGPRMPGNPDAPNEAGATRIAPSNEDLFSYEEEGEVA